VPGQRLSRKGFAAIAVVTLALGIGANTAIFSLLHAALLKPLPFSEPNELVLLFESTKNGRTLVSYSNLEDRRQQNEVFEDLSAFGGNNLNATGDHHAERLGGGFVSGSFFRILGVQPLLGRTLASADDRPGAAKVAVISHSVWQRRYGADPGVLRQNITLMPSHMPLWAYSPRDSVSRLTTLRYGSPHSIS
jgi:putative ABC transport system permease protein